MSNITFPSHWRRYLWPLLLGLLLKGAFFIWNHHESAALKHMGSWAVWDSDLWEYVDTAESYLRGDGWDPDHRMPGYAVVYLFFRLFLSQPAASDALTLVQLLLATLATFALARGVAQVSGHQRLFWPLYLLLLVSSFHALVEIAVINESLTGTALALHWVAYVAYRRTGHRGWLVASGALMAVAVFMRPILGPLLAVVPALEFFRKGAAIRSRVISIALFGLPFLLADGAWALRNHHAYGGFHPLTNHGSYNPVFSALPYYSVIVWVQAYGGHCYYWDPIADIRWYGFEPDAGGGTDKEIPGVSPPPEHVYTFACTPDSLVAFANLMRYTRRVGAPLAESDSIARVMMASALRFREAYAQERPFHYQVLSRLRLLKHETVHSGTATLFQRPFAELNWLEKIYKLGQSLLYWWVLIAGMIGGLWFAFRARSHPEAALLGIMAVYGVLACPFIMRMAEIRYLIPVYPLLAGISLWVVFDIARRLRSRA